MKIETVKLSELISPNWNPRQISSAEMEKLKNSLKSFGYIDPLIVNRTNNHIVGGNQRAEALKQLGYEDVEVIFVDISDINKEKALNIALNKISGDWDDDKLEEVLNEIQLSNIDIALTGFDEIELKKFDIDDEPLDNIVEDEYVEEDEIIVNVELGDKYKLGTHILLCGDSSNPDNIRELIGNAKISLILTDPPYGMGLDTDYSVLKAQQEFYTKKHCKGRGKKYKQRKIDEFEDTFIKNILALDVKETILWGADYYTDALPEINEGSWFVWDKRSNENSDEEATKKMDKMFGSMFELAWSRNRHRREIIRVRWAGLFGTETEFDSRRYHPTQKPIKLNAWFLDKLTAEREAVLDLFGGGGSTLLACEQLNRRCFMMEIDPYYCQIIINRWESLTGYKAIKIE